MRTMLLSFKADVFQRLISGEKIYEHRKVFPEEPVLAYLYVSDPIKAIKGIMLLSNRTLIEDWKEKYAFDLKAQHRIREYLKSNRYAMEINYFQNTNEISLNQLRKDIPGFVVPQMYYYIDDSSLLRYLKKNLVPVGERIIHDYSNISSEQICQL